MTLAFNAHATAYFKSQGEDVRNMLEEIRCDLIRLRTELPVNSHRGKGIFKKIDRALAAIINSRRTDRNVAEAVWP